MKRHGSILDRERAAAIVRTSLWGDAQDIVKYLALEKLIQNPDKTLLDAVFEGVLYKLTLTVGEAFYDLYAPVPGAQKMHDDSTVFFVETNLQEKIDAFNLTARIPWDTREGIEQKILQDVPAKQETIKKRLDTCLTQGYLYRLTLITKRGAGFSLYAFSPRLLLASMALVETPEIRAFILENFDKYDEETFNEMLKEYIDKEFN